MKPSDWRRIGNGREIPTENYSDQPYIVIADDGAWVCVMTTGAGHEGQSGQHVVTLRSLDQGETWEEPVDVEPANGPEASYAVLLKSTNGRIYCFYNHNTDNIRKVIGDNPPYTDGFCRRVDSLGYFVMKYSDDHGKSWSRQRYPLPMREMDIDRQNPYQGRIRFFWNVGRPFIHEGTTYVSVHKVGGFGAGFFTRSEGVLLRSDNLLTVDDPSEAEWVTLPEGEYGLRTPPGGGPISEEQSYSVLSDGSFYCVYRSVDGSPVCTYSRDFGKTWSTPSYKSYADGRPMRHPRAANFAWRCTNGNYLYWFHNHGGKGYDDRNPVWLCGGHEVDTPEGRIIAWSQPEVVLYDPDPYVRMSYPDLIETDDGHFFLSETQKDIARVHEIPGEFLELLWSQPTRCETALSGIIAECVKPGMSMNMPKLPEFTTRDNSRADYGTRQTTAGFTVELSLAVNAVSNAVILDTKDDEGKGFAFFLDAEGTVRLELGDGRTQCCWSSDKGIIRPGSSRHVTVIVDSGPKIIMFVIDGILCDGGTERQFGWGRFNPDLRSANGSDQCRLTSSGNVSLEMIRLYGRAIRVTEAIGNYRAFIQQ